MRIASHLMLTRLSFLTPPPSLNASIEPPTGRAGHGLSPALTFAVSVHPVVDTKAAAGEAGGSTSLPWLVLCCSVWLLHEKNRKLILAVQM